MKYEQKIFLFEKVLTEKSVSYADSFKPEIIIFFDEISSKNSLLQFLNNIEDEKSIRNWINKLTSRIVMHEDDDLVSEILNDYYLNG